MRPGGKLARAPRGRQWSGVRIAGWAVALVAVAIVLAAMVVSAVGGWTRSPVARTSEAQWWPASKRLDLPGTACTGDGAATVEGTVEEAGDGASVRQRYWEGGAVGSLGKRVDILGGDNQQEFAARLGVSSARVGYGDATSTMGYRIRCTSCKCAVAPSSTTGSPFTTHTRTRGFRWEMRRRVRAVQAGTKGVRESLVCARAGGDAACAREGLASGGRLLVL